MEIMTSTAELAIILSLGIFVQATTGFAAGLVIVPALVWCDYSIPDAQCSLLVATIPQNIWGVWSLRDSISPADVAGPGLGRVVFLPLGAWVLVSLESLDESTIRQILGGIVVAATVAIMVIRPTPRERISPVWGWLAFPVSGFFQGLVGIGGPIIVFWVQAHDWSTRRTRAFLFAMYLISIFPALVILYLFFGGRIIMPGFVAAAMSPLMLLVTYWGLKLGTKLGRERLRRISFVLLLMMGLSSLLAPVL